MEKSFTSDYHKQQLLLLTDYLNGDGWNAVTQPPISVRPYDSTIVDIVSSEDETQVLWQMELSYLPILADDLVGVSILQCFVPLANTFTALLRPELFEMILKINTKLPLVGFGFMDEFSLLYFKCNVMLKDDAAGSNGRIVSESLAMITRLIDDFCDPILYVATGEKSISKAIEGMSFKELYS